MDRTSERAPLKINNLAGDYHKPSINGRKMNATELEFEKPLIELERHLAQLNAFSETHPELDLTEGIATLKQNTDTPTKQTFQNLI